MNKELLVNGAAVFMHALNYKLIGRRVPLMVSVGLTRKCNLRCPFCYAVDSGDNSAEISAEQLLNYIDQFIALGTRIFLLQGGEPLLRKELKELIAHIKNK